MFSLLSNFFDFALLRQGQFMQRIKGKSKGLKRIRFNKQAYLYIQNSTNFDIQDLLDFIPKTLKARSRTILALASLVFLKAKAHDSKNHLAANIFLKRFSEGE